MQALEARRAKGRDDYPVQAMWNAVIAGVAFQPPSVASLRRELGRNPALIDRCVGEEARGRSPHDSPCSVSRRSTRLRVLPLSGDPGQIGSGGRLHEADDQPTPHFIRNFFRSGSFLGGKTPLVQAHTTLDRARC